MLIFRSKSENGFTLIEVLISLLLVSLLLGVMVSVVQNAATLNAKAKLRADAGSLAFKKIQDYINIDYDTIPIGDTATSYEVEDFSTEAEAFNLRNASAKIYVEPESEISVPTTTTLSDTQAVSADTAFALGAEIPAVDQDVAVSGWNNISRIRDNNYSNYTYKFSGSSNNEPSPSIDLGSPQTVDTIRVNWFACGYGSNDFRIQAKNSSPSSNSGWTNIVTGLSDNNPPCSSGNNPQDIDVSSNATQYRHWRVYFDSSDDSRYNVISELEAFSPGTPGDTVEQFGADASGSTPGDLDFDSSDLEMADNGSRGTQSIGMIFRDVEATQGSTIDDAYINFVADESDSGPVTLLITGANVDNASPWIGNFAVDNAVDSDNSDGSTGTIATTTWSPQPWSAGESGPDTRVDVTHIIQEIVNRGGWTDGNNIAIAVQYVSGTSKRVAERLPAPQLVVSWSESVTTTPGNYVDSDMDGDVDNPTLIRVTSIVEYDSFQQRRKVEYSTYIRKFGVGD